MMQSTFALLTVLFLLVGNLSSVYCLINTASHWEFGGLRSNSRCEYIFHQSINEKVRKDHSDPLFIWLGRPSSAIQTMISRKISGSKGTKSVPLPLPTLWISFVNILYVTKCYHIAVDASYPASDNSQSFEVLATPIHDNTIGFVKAFELFLTKDWAVQSTNFSRSFRFINDIDTDACADAIAGVDARVVGEDVARSLYVGGNLADPVGGMHTVEVAMMLMTMLDQPSCLHPTNRSGRLSLKGVLIGDVATRQSREASLSPSPAASRGVLHYRPTAQFVPFKSFESIPGHVGGLANPNVYKLDRINQPVVCNSLFSEVEFWLNDVHLTYMPSADHSGTFGKDEVSERLETGNAGAEMYEYRLTAISTFRKCYYSVEDWRNDPQEEMWYSGSSDISPIENKQDIYPVLPVANATVKPFPGCRSQTATDHAIEDDASVVETGHQTSEQSRSIRALLHRGLTVFVYNTIHKSPRPICSFYIGIYECDTLNWSVRGQSHNDSGVVTGEIRHDADADVVAAQELQWFDAATLVDMVEDVGRSNSVDSSGSDDTSDSSVDNMSTNEKVNMVTVGQIQDSGCNSCGSRASSGGRLIWSHFDSSSSSSSSFVSISKHMAVDMLRRLVENTHDINYVDIYA